MSNPSRTLSSVLLLVLSALLGGCADTAPESPATRPSSLAARADHGECLVCKHNADLACVDIPVTQETPRAQYNGKTYYFCSEACKRDFLKAPDKYASK